MLLLSFLLSSWGAFAPAGPRLPVSHLRPPVFLTSEDPAPPHPQSPLSDALWAAAGSQVKHTEALGLNTKRVLWSDPAPPLHSPRARRARVCSERSDARRRRLFCSKPTDEGTHATHSLLFITSNQSKYFLKLKRPDKWRRRRRLWLLILLLLLLWIDFLCSWQSFKHLVSKVFNLKLLYIVLL